jgi:hypothetical protein
MLSRSDAISMPGVTVTIGNADQRRRMRADHARPVGDHSRDGSEEHAVMAHDAVVDGDGAELASPRPDRGDQLAGSEVNMPRHELVKVYRDVGLPKSELHAGGAPEAAGAGHVAAMGWCGRRRA